MRMKFKIFALCIGIVCLLSGIAIGIWIENTKRLKRQTIEVSLDDLQAYVIPQSTRLMQGQTYSAQIGLMLANSVHGQEIYINDRLIEDGLMKIPLTEVGNYAYRGKILLRQNDNSIREYPFESHFLVEEPWFVVSADLMNVLYAGIENPISIGASIPFHQLTATARGGKLIRRGTDWVAIPSKNSDTFTILVSYVDGEKTKVLGTKVFQVKPASEKSH